MSKIICDVCGTSYPETADCCPICGCTRDEAILLGEEFAMEEQAIRSGGNGGRFHTKKKKEIFDFDEVNAVREDDRIQEVRYDDDIPVPGKPRHNTFAVIVLTVLIAVLALLAAFLVLRFFTGRNEISVAPETTLAVTEETAAETQSVSIPCQSLALTSGTAHLTTEGAFFLVNVSVVPENTTDKLIYHSLDSSIATVDENGRITAVAEGSTVIYITCGTHQIPCEVVCDFSAEEPAAPETEAAEEPAGETVAETTPVTEPAETEAAETEPPETQPKQLKDVVLKLNKSDFWMYLGQTFQLELLCDLDPSEVEWSVDRYWIADVDETGNVLAKSKGDATITVKYGDQEVTCIVRCKKK